MIVRILGEGQYEIAETRLGGLNELDAVLQSAVEAGDEAAFAGALRALLDAVRSAGKPLPDAVLTGSDLVLPDESMNLARVRALVTEEGLIPG